MKKNLSVRVMTFLLSVVMLLGCVQMTALADEVVCSHEFSAWKVQTHPTADSEGVLFRACDRCGETETKQTGKLSMPFYDVGLNRWSNPYITMLYTYGVINGTSANLFTPAGNVTRAQFVKMLFGLADDELGDGSTVFEDVDSASWYAPYVRWAAENGVTNGVTPTRFVPDGNITRQDMAVMLYRYISSSVEMELAGADSDAQQITFSDDANIADYAKEAVYAMQRAGIIGGMANDDGTFRFEPKGNATREQAAKMIGELYCRSFGSTLPEPIPSATFKITYTNIDGAVMSNKRESYNCEDSFTLPQPTRTGYEFIGWTGTGVGNSPVKKVTVKVGSYGDRSYKANWVYESYNITYNLKGGTISGAPKSYTMFTADFIIPRPTKTGYEFLGWSVSGKSGLYKDYTVKKGTTGWLGLTANWKELGNQEFTFDKMAEAIVKNADGDDGNGNKYIVYTLGDSLENSVTITYYKSTDTIELTRMCLVDGGNSIRMIGVALELKASGKSFDYVYMDYTLYESSESVALIASGYVTGKSFAFEPVGGNDASSSSRVSSHEATAEEYLTDIYDVVDKFCSTYVGSGRGISSFGLSYN